MNYPNKIWVVFDLSNGDELTKQYAWYFKTRERARKHIRWVKHIKYAARLSGPMLYNKN